jgi:hypothetical protein
MHAINRLTLNREMPQASDYFFENQRTTSKNQFVEAFIVAAAAHDEIAAVAFN